LLILWTVREGELLEEAVKYCENRGLSFYAINSNMPDKVDARFATRKVSVDLYIDDRNLGGLPEWGIIYQMIKNNKALEPYSYEIENEYTKKTKKSIISKMLGLYKHKLCFFPLLSSVIT